MEKQLIKMRFLYRGRHIGIGIIYQEHGWRIAALGKKRAAQHMPPTSNFRHTDKKERMQ